MMARLLRPLSSFRRCLRLKFEARMAVPPTVYAQIVTAAFLIAWRESSRYKVAGRAGRWLGQEAYERDIRNKTERRRYLRNHPRDFSRAGHRAGHPHFPVSAIQYSVRFNEGDAAGRRLSVRV